MLVKTDSIATAKPVAHGDVPHWIENCCTLENPLSYQVMMLQQYPRTLSSADLALQDTGALAAAEYGRLSVWTHFG